jgi:T-complex protein 1 subunit beta
VLDEAERSLHDALCVLSQTVADSRVIYGGGWAEIQMAAVVDDLAARTPGKRSLAMAAFARALRQIPTIICDNAGLDSAEIVSQMRAAHAAAPDAAVACGVDVTSGGVGDMSQRGVFEAFKVKAAALMSATEAAEMILRVDDIIKMAPRQRQ